MLKGSMMASIGRSGARSGRRTVPRRAVIVSALLTLALLTLALVAGGVAPVLAGFQPHQTFGVGDGPRSVAAADFNGDGKLDLAAANQIGNNVSVLRNITATGASTPAFATQQTFATGSLPWSLVAADVNGDGRPDLAVTNFVGNNVSVLLNTTLSITDDDPSPTLSIADVTVTEGNSGSANAVFTVTLSAASGQTVTVQYATADGTATAGTDYTATSGTLTFLPGETSKTISVPVLGDPTVEADEAFTVTLSSPTGGATLAQAQATGTIPNTDSVCGPRPRVTLTPAPGGGKLQVNLASTPLNTNVTNPMTSLTFDALSNARVTLNGQTISSGQTVTLPANSTTVAFTVERITAGQATTAQLTVTDGCGTWKTVVGGGASAGF